MVNLIQDIEYPSMFIKDKSNGFIWAIPLKTIADNYASYYEEVDPDSSYSEEFAYIMENPREGQDWYANNMDFVDVKDKAVLVLKPRILPSDGPGTDNESFIIKDESRISEYLNTKFYEPA